MFAFFHKLLSNGSSSSRLIDVVFSQFYNYCDYKTLKRIHSNSLLTEQRVSIYSTYSNIQVLHSQSLSFCVLFQFYKCFLILFHCSHWSADNGNTSMPSKTTVIQLNRRVYSNTVACADHLSTDALRQCCGTNTISTTNTPAIEVKLSWRRMKPNHRPSLLCMCLMCDVVPVKGGDILSARFVLFVRVYTFVHPRDRLRLRQSVNSTTTTKKEVVNF